MKSIIFAICVCFVQICSSAPTATEDKTDLSDADIQEICDTLSIMPGVQDQAVDDFKDIVKKFRKNSTDDDIVQATFELLSLAVHGDNLNNKAIDLKQILQKISNETDFKSTEKGKGTTMNGLTQNELKEMEDELTKLLKPAQTEHAMKILHAFRVGATKKEGEAAIFDLITSALEKLVSGVTVSINRPQDSEIPEV